MKLEFELRSAYGRNRYYPLNTLADAVVALTDKGARKCLRQDEVEYLERAGFEIEIIKQEKMK